MDFSNRLTVSEAKKMGMVTFLSSLGFEPVKIRGNDYWYLSPLRDEKTPSFKVNRKLNRWYDHGIGKGGNLLDFAILYHGCSIAELLNKWTHHFSFQQPTHYPPIIKNEPEYKIKICSESILASFSLLRYLEQRRIPVGIAEKFCREVRYELNEKTYYGIGFKNDLGGYEIRNPYFKASSAPNAITTIENGAEEAAVFEGFTDFLSFMSIHQNEPEDRFDFVVLNSVAFFETARPFMEKHKVVRLYLDHDAAGQNCSRHALALSDKYRDESVLYKNHKDLNDWLVHFGKAQRKNERPRLR